MFSLLINTLSFAGPAARLAAAPATRMATPVMQGYGLAVRDRYDMDYYGGGGYYRYYCGILYFVLWYYYYYYYHYYYYTR